MPARPAAGQSGERRMNRFKHAGCGRISDEFVWANPQITMASLGLQYRSQFGFDQATQFVQGAVVWNHASAGRTFPIPGPLASVPSLEFVHVPSASSEQYLMSFGSDLQAPNFVTRFAIAAFQKQWHIENYKRSPVRFRFCDFKLQNRSCSRMKHAFQLSKSSV